MLQFWRKPAKKNCSNSFSEVCRTNERLKHHNTAQEYDEKYEFIQISEEISQLGNGEIKTKSSVAKMLSEVLIDKNALNYFIQYMESRNSEAYILCWVDVENFKSDLPKHKSSTVDHDTLSSDTDSVFSNNSSDFSESSNVVEKNNNNCDKESSDISCSLKLNNNNNREHLTDSALAIFKKYIAQEAVYNIKCTNDLRKELIENICDNSKLISRNCFEKVQDHVCKIMEKDYFEHFMTSDYYCKYQIDILTSGNTTLDDILSNETALFYFMEFLEQENHRNLLEFWIAATNFQQQLRHQNEFFDPVEAQNDAVVLYDKYFSLQAHCPLHLGDKVRLALEQTICGEDGVNLDCFKLPILIVERILEKYFIQPFLESQLFYKFLSELINTVQSNGYATNIQKHERLPSDADSEHSFASSTFLAMEINHKKDTRSKTDMTIDTRELYDPDSLWKQKRKNKLLCGHVTDLGRFETDFEPEPDSGEMNLKKVIKKFVDLEEEQRKKEEMAWQVAEMIIRDITNITLKNHD